MASGVGLQNQQQWAGRPVFAVFNPPHVVKAGIDETNLRINDLENMLLSIQNGFRDNAVERV